MPANLKDLRHRIKSVKNTQQITKAMKLVSAAKFGRAQTAVVNSRPYSTELTSLVKKLAYFVRGGCAHPLLTENSSKHALLLVASSERGLCGGFNANIVKHAQKTWDKLKAEGYTVSVLCIGKKAYQSLLSKNRDEQKSNSDESLTQFVDEEVYIGDASQLLNSSLTLLTTPFEKQLNQSIDPLSEAISYLYAEEKIGKIVVVYSEFQSAMSQEPVDETILPLSQDVIASAEEAAEAKDTFKDEGEPIFEPERDDLFSSILPRYMSSQILHMLLESRASEHGARMTAMDNATRNGKEMEKKLQITYQRARQAAITNELIEIISGAEAL